MMETRRRTSSSTRHQQRRREDSSAHDLLQQHDDDDDEPHHHPVVQSAEDVLMVHDEQQQQQQPAPAVASQVPSRKSGRSGAPAPKSKQQAAPPPKSKLLKRRNSISKQGDGGGGGGGKKEHPSSAKLPILALDDPEPGRLTNPLVEDCNVRIVQDLLRVTNGIEFHRPDTYSLHYCARLLGLQDEVLALSSNAQEEGMVPTQQLLEHLQSQQQLQVAKSDPIFQIPPRGTFPAHLQFWGDDDSVLLKEQAEEFDPLFQQLLEIPADQAVTVVVTAKQNASLLQLNHHHSTTTATTANTSPDATPAAAVAATTSTTTSTPLPHNKSTGAAAVPRSPRQQAILDQVLQTEKEILTSASNNQNLLSYRDQYDFLPLEQARELFPTVVQRLLEASAHPNVLTGWVAVTKLSSEPTPTPPDDETMEQRGVHEDVPAAADDLSVSSSTDDNISGSELASGDRPATSKAAAIAAPAPVPDRRRVVGGVVCQVEWYRSGAERRVEASEAIVHVLGLTTNLAAVISKVDEDESLDDETQSWLRLVLTALVLEQARACQIWYAVFGRNNNNSKDANDSFLSTYFRATSSTVNNNVVADVHKTSTRYSFLRYLQERTKLPAAPTRQQEEQEHVVEKRRWLVRLPTVEEARAALIPPEEEGELHQRPQRGLVRRSSSSNFSTGSSVFITSASQAQRNMSLSIRAVPPQGEAEEEQRAAMKLWRINEDGSDGPPLDAPQFYKEPASLDILRNFAVSGPPRPPPNDEETMKEQRAGEVEEDLVFQELTRKQEELQALEASFGPPLRSLLSKVVTERLEYESAEATAQRVREKQVLADAEQMLERRKELDVAWQKQLEQDMDAVCEICRDGEVTPDNQILFCEACNVAVHQYCYGIDKIPEGDYYCDPCRRLGRDKHKDTPHLAAAIPQPLPICCELCPLRQGAFIRTATKPLNGATCDRWVHVVCAKWQGLNYVDPEKQDLVEDVTQLRIGFRQHGIKCELCQGERGAMNKCCFGNDECNKWFHISCARAVGTLKVTHGENCKGAVDENPWTLCCPEHSNISPEDVPKDATAVEKLILAAQEFPPEPCPPPAPRPFNQLTGPERKALLTDPDYESKLMFELLRKRFYGVRCEVCDLLEEESKNLTRCALCNVVFCNACKLHCDEMKGNYKCPSCRHVEAKKKAGEQVEAPNCCACYQPGGLLRETVAEPVMKFGYWKHRQKEFEESMFRRELWIHSMCAFWNPNVFVPADTGIVDLSNVIMADGKRMIQNKIACILCGNRGGLKMRCDREGCNYTNSHDRKEGMYMHVTCARQAGFEVRLDDNQALYFYVRCYRHGGNEYNLRARLEDLIEIEKRRSGKDLSRSDAPMKFSDGSRITNAAVQVMKMLGWAWRWAEWWVDYNSSWEPLLEPGQKESRMTKEELKIVDSTRESRCEDARRCRLAAFGAALRNRDYDTADGFDREAFDKAIRAILHTQSLVGPLEAYEINFFAEWLGRAYRSKSRLLGFGDSKISVTDRPSFATIHLKDQSPKYILGGRPLPGRGELQKDGIFEIDVDDVDDFMMRDLLVDSPPKPRSPPSVSEKRSEEDRKKRRRERDRARRERDRARKEAERASNSEAEPARKKGRKALTRQPLPADESENEGAFDSDRVAAVVPTAVKRRGRPPRDRSVANLPAPDASTGGETTARESSRNKRRPGRPRRSTHPLDESFGSVEPLSRVTTRKKRRDRSTGEAEPEYEDYAEELAPSPPKRRPGRTSRNRKPEAGKPKIGRPRKDRKQALFAPDTSDEEDQDATAFDDSVAYLPPEEEAWQEDSEALSKFDLVKSRRRQTRRTMNVGARLASKSYDEPMGPVAVKRPQPKDNEDDMISISDLVSKRKKQLPTLPPYPPSDAQPPPAALVAPARTRRGESNSTNVDTVGDGSTEQDNEATLDEPEASTGDHTDDLMPKRGRLRGKQRAVDQTASTEDTEEDTPQIRGRLRAKQQAVGQEASTEDDEDTPQKRGRRRGKQQAVDQLSLTLSQLRPRRHPRYNSA